MTRRRKVALGILAGAALVGALIGTNTHWRLYGLCSGEPFCDGLPASYYASRIRAAWVIREDLGGSVRPRPIAAPEGWLRRNVPGIARAFWPDYITSNDSHLPFDPATADACKLPVLLVLVRDADMLVRWWASEKLGQLTGESIPASITALTALLESDDPTARFLGAMALAQRRASDRAALPALSKLRGDKTRVSWFGMTLGELADAQIGRIDPASLKARAPP